MSLLAVSKACLAGDEASKSLARLLKSLVLVDLGCQHWTFVWVEREKQAVPPTDGSVETAGCC